MYVLVVEQIFRIVPGIRHKRQVEKGFSQNFAKVADSSVRKNLAKNEEKSGSKPICPHGTTDTQNLGFRYRTGSATDTYLKYNKNVYSNE